MRKFRFGGFCLFFFFLYPADLSYSPWAQRSAARPCSRHGSCKQETCPTERAQSRGIDKLNMYMFEICNLLTGEIQSICWNRSRESSRTKKKTKSMQSLIDCPSPRVWPRLGTVATKLDEANSHFVHFAFLFATKAEKYEFTPACIPRSCRDAYKPNVGSTYERKVNSMQVLGEIKKMFPPTP